MSPQTPVPPAIVPRKTRDQPRFALLFFGLGSLALACGGAAATPSPQPDGGGDGAVRPADGPAPVTWSAAMGSCAVQAATFPLLGGAHVVECSPLPPGTSPRTSGPHYPSWPVFRVYDRPVPWGFLLHGLEHGAVVIAYNCPDGCAADIDAAKKVVAAAAPKAGCLPVAPPVIMTPDPTLEPGFKFVAAAWGQGLRAKCFDAPAFTQFIQTNANHGPEFFPTDCGAVDREATGWCP